MGEEQVVADRAGDDRGLLLDVGQPGPHLGTAPGAGARAVALKTEAGGSHISVVTMGANLTTVDGHIEAIRRWRDVYNSVR